MAASAAAVNDSLRKWSRILSATALVTQPNRLFSQFSPPLRSLLPCGMFTLETSKADWLTALIVKFHWPPDEATATLNVS
jgi:hypothetical protein